KGPRDTLAWPSGPTAASSSRPIATGSCGSGRRHRCDCPRHRARGERGRREWGEFRQVELGEPTGPTTPTRGGNRYAGQHEPSPRSERRPSVGNPGGLSTCELALRAGGWVSRRERWLRAGGPRSEDSGRFRGREASPLLILLANSPRGPFGQNLGGLEHTGNPN